MGESSPRAEMIGALKQTRGLDLEAIAALFTGEGHAPAPLTEAERERLATATLDGAPRMSPATIPNGSRRSSRRLRRGRGGGGAGARRPRAGRPARQPLENHREKALAALAHLDAEPTPLSPVGLRIAIRPDGRGPALAAEPAYVKGLVEVQDEGSQLAALISGAKPGMQVLDLCAGAGGKTLALAADDGQPRPDLRHRRRRAPPDADLRAPGALGRAQRAGPGAEGRRRTGSPISRAAATS